MSKVSFKIEGLKELADTLAELPKATTTNVFTRILTKAGQPIAHSGEANAPRRSGQLAESYAVTKKLSKRQRQRHKKESKVEMFVGPMPHPKSVQTEFGNSHQAAHPHLRPAWDANKQGTLDIITQDLGAEIEAARARRARKAEREAARMKT